MADGEVRDAVQEDLPFLIELAVLFGQGPGRSAVVDWKRPDSDFGLILQEAGIPVAAAWWRFASGPSEEKPWPDMREVFLGVIPSRQGEGIGPRLLDQLVERGRADPDLRRLVGRIVNDPQRAQRIQRMLEERGFTPNNNWVSWGLGVFWILDVQSQTPSGGAAEHLPIEVVRGRTAGSDEPRAVRAPRLIDG